jgi:hypothetical protein
MHPAAALLTILLLPDAALANGRGSSYKSAADGPDKLDECGCWPIYQKMLTCQKIKGVNAGIRECVCVPNPDGWYTSMDGCRTCLLSSASTAADSDNNFFDNLSRTVTQLFVSCTNAGGGVVSDGGSICASNSMFRACAGLREKSSGQASWASIEVFAKDGTEGTKGNGTQVLNIAEYQDGEGDDATSTATTRAVSGTSTAATETATTATTAVPNITGSPSITPITTTATESSPSQSATTTTTSSSAMGRLGSASLIGSITGLAVAVGLGAVLF